MPNDPTHHGSRVTLGAVVMTLVLIVVSLTACGPKKGSSGCAFVRPKIITVGSVPGVAPAPAAGQPEELPKPRPKPPKTPKTKEERKKSCSASNSPVWKGFRNIGDGYRTDGTYYYRWDYTHQDIEKWDKHGKHLGSVDPSTGKVYRGPQKTHNLPKSKRPW